MPRYPLLKKFYVYNQHIQNWLFAGHMHNDTTLFSIITHLTCLLSTLEYVGDTIGCFCISLKNQS